MQATTNRSFFMLLVTILSSSMIQAQSSHPATDYLNVPGPVMFQNKAFNLSWTSHPAANFYKQEYIVKGDQADKYKMMVLLDVVTDEKNIKTVVSAKVAELKKMKESNPVVNYEIIENPTTGEYVLDFLLSANAADGKTIGIIERNVYRYKTFTDQSGHQGIILFGISVREYGAGVTAFLTRLKATRQELVKQVATFKIPAVNITN